MSRRSFGSDIRFCAGFNNVKLCGQFFPPRLRPAVRPEDPSRCPGINTAIERFVTFPQLLPFQLGKAALILDCDQLLCGQLFQPFSIDPAWQMKKAGRKPLSIHRAGDFRRIKPQEAIGLGLKCRGGDSPKARPTAKTFAADGGIDIGRPRHRACPIEALKALDRGHLSKAHAAEKLEAWRRYYNEERPHGAIGNKAPITLTKSGGNTSLSL